MNDVYKRSNNIEDIVNWIPQYLRRTPSFSVRRTHLNIKFYRTQDKCRFRLVQDGSNIGVSKSQKLWGLTLRTP